MEATSTLRTLIGFCITPRKASINTNDTSVECNRPIANCIIDNATPSPLLAHKETREKWRSISEKAFAFAQQQPSIQTGATSSVNETCHCSRNRFGKWLKSETGKPGLRRLRIASFPKKG